MGRKVLMMLRIGNRGFTLIETLVAVSVLSLGLVMLYEAFFSCLNAFSYSQRRLDVQQWMDEKLWELEDELIRRGALVMVEHAGRFTKNNNHFFWQMSIDLLDSASEANLYRLDLNVYWRQAQKNIRLSQAAYVHN
jgi:prepilin-type N-terminal cleavage/methylation domain-containing protein